MLGVKTHPAGRRRAPALVAVVRPVTKRLTKIEELLLEIRHEIDVKLKRLNDIHVRLDAVEGGVEANRRAIEKLVKAVAKLQSR